VKVKLMEYFERETEKKKKTVFTAIITDVRNHGFFIEVAEAGALAWCRSRRSKDDFYVLNGAGTAFIGRKTKRKFELGPQGAGGGGQGRPPEAPDRFHGAVRQTANPAHSSGQNPRWRARVRRAVIENTKQPSSFTTRTDSPASTQRQVHRFFRVFGELSSLSLR